MSEVAPLRQERLAGLGRRSGIIWAFSNVGAAGLLVEGAAGSSPSLQFLTIVAPLPAWGAAFLVAGLVIMTAGDNPVRHLAGKSIAALLWATLAFGSALGVALARSNSPTASGLFALVETAAAAQHVSAMFGWRSEQLARRRERRSEGPLQ